MKKLITLICLLITVQALGFWGGGGGGGSTPIASESVAGKVIPDGVTITVNGTGVITAIGEQSAVNPAFDNISSAINGRYVQTGAASAAQGATADTAVQTSVFNSYTTNHVIGTDVQAYDADLTSWAAIAPSAKQDALTLVTSFPSSSTTNPPDANVVSDALDLKAVFRNCTSASGGTMTTATKSQYCDLAISDSIPTVVFMHGAALCSAFSPALSTTNALCSEEGASTGYTNLTSFIAQTAWRLFYSDTAGDVTELALGADGEYLKSNGAAAAPTWETPSGAAHDAVTIGATPNGLSLATQVLSLGLASTSTIGALSDTDWDTFNNKLATNGSAASLTSFPTLNQNTTGTAAGLSATLAVASGGTGATTLTGALVGNGSSAVTALDCTDGQVIKRGASTWACGADDSGTGSGTVSSGTTGQFAYYGSNGTTVAGRTLVAGDVPTLNQSTTGSAATLTTTRAIYGNNFDGSAALTQVIASTYGGTGNGFTKFTGPTTAERTFTLPDASSTLLYSGGALGTPASGTLTNATGLPIAGLTASTSTALGVGSIELGHATDTTITRVSAGVAAVEGVTVLTKGQTFTKCTVIKGATTTDDYPLEKFPYAITITGVRVYAIGGTNVVGGYDECTGTAGVCSSVTAVDADITGTAGSSVADDGTLTNGPIAADNWIQWHTTSVSGTNTSLSACFNYTID